MPALPGALALLAAGLVLAPLEALALPRCPRPMFAQLAVRAMHPPRADSNRYLPATSAEQEAFAASLRAFAGGDLVTASAEAAALRYALCLDADVAVWRPLDATGRAHVAWRVGPAAPVVLSVPHPLADLGTLRQGVEVFRRARLRALVASGTHRCANWLPAGCPGTTKTCHGDFEAYRLSDMAHNHETLFQVAHKVLMELDEAPYFVSVHGMSARGAIVSDGTDRPSVDPTAFSVRLTQQLAAVFKGVRSCNDVAGVPSTESLCGTWNAQGLLVNGDAGSCHDIPTAASGRFVHLEQSRKLRKRPKLLARAIRRALRAPLEPPLPTRGP